MTIYFLIKLYHTFINTQLKRTLIKSNKYIREKHHSIRIPTNWLYLFLSAFMYETFSQSRTQHSRHLRHLTLIALDGIQSTCLDLPVCFIALWGLWLTPARNDVTIQGLDLTEAGGVSGARGTAAPRRRPPLLSSSPLFYYRDQLYFSVFRSPLIFAATDWYKKKQLNCVCFLLCYHIFLSVVISQLIIFLEVVLNSLFLPDCNRRRFIVFECMFLYFNSFGTVVTKKVWCICTWEVSFDSS